MWLLVGPNKQFVDNGKFLLFSAVLLLKQCTWLYMHLFVLCTLVVVLASFCPPQPYPFQFKRELWKHFWLIVHSVPPEDIKCREGGNEMKLKPLLRVIQPSMDLWALKIIVHKPNGCAYTHTHTHCRVEEKCSCVQHIQLPGLIFSLFTMHHPYT